MWRSLRFSKVFFAGVILLIAIPANAVAKVHVITFGRWIQVQWSAAQDSIASATKVRALIVDGRAKEYVVGMPHEITERLFVMRWVFRINDSLPEESAAHWQWERGGWLLIDRVTGRVSAINLPAFDPYLSAASWYRDYVAYCGVSDDGKKAYAVVAQVSRRKHVLKKALPEIAKNDAESGPICPAPVWQRNPVRVSFTPPGAEKQTFAVRGTAVDLVSDEDEEE